MYDWCMYVYIYILNHDRFDFFFINSSTDAIPVRWSFGHCDKCDKSNSAAPFGWTNIHYNFRSWCSRLQEFQNELNIPETSHLLAVSRPKTPEAVNKIMLQMAVLNERLVAYSGETAMGWEMTRGFHC